MITIDNFLTLPVYRLPAEEYYRQRDAYMDKHLYPPDDPLTATTRRKAEKANPNSSIFIRDHLEKAYGGPWNYNEIIGFIELNILGTQIRGSYWRVDAKKIVRTKTKRFRWDSWKLAPEMELPWRGSNADIYAVILAYVARCEAEVKGRFVDTSSLTTIGPYVDWQALLRAGLAAAAERAAQAGAVPRRA